MMYKKIIYISINVFEGMTNLSKANILLFVTFISFIRTELCKPFSLKRMNILELYSNMSASIVLISGIVYLLGVNEYYEVVIFLIILITNSVFLFLWFNSMIDIVLSIYSERLMRFCPKFIKALSIFIKAWKLVKFSWNLIIYFSNLIKIYKEIKSKSKKRGIRILDLQHELNKKTVVKSRFNIEKPLLIGRRSFSEI